MSNVIPRTRPTIHKPIEYVGLNDTRGANMLFRRIEPRRPTVVRKGNIVQVCYLYKNMNQCLGPQCFWPKVGKCPIYNRLKTRRFAK